MQILPEPDYISTRITDGRLLSAGSKQIIDSGVIGKPFKARVSFLSGFPVFDNQPFLMELDHFILTDMGSHVLDVVRFLFGECESLWCQTRAVNRK